MSKKWRLTDRTRTLLTLELAIVLPAAALLGFSIWNLKHIQRSEAIEAAIQRDFSHVLKIAEKKTWHKANEIVAPIRKEFPNPDEDRATITAKLEHILTEHPEYSYAFVYDKDKNMMVSRLQPAKGQRPGILRQHAGCYQHDVNVAASGSNHDGGDCSKDGHERRRPGRVLWLVGAQGKSAQLLEHYLFRSSRVCPRIARCWEWWVLTPIICAILSFPR